MGVVFDMQFAGLMHQKDLGKIKCSILYIGLCLLMQKPIRDNCCRKELKAADEMLQHQQTAARPSTALSH